jgi:YHS domain-containing protein
LLTVVPVVATSSTITSFFLTKQLFFKSLARAKVNKSVNTIIDGKLYYFCCPGCIGSFRKNQQKYSGKLENAETKTLEVTNKDGKCPISGKKAKLKFFKIDQENKTITFYHDKSSLHQAQK